jgi:hypothetical protein
MKRIILSVVIFIIYVSGICFAQIDSKDKTPLEISEIVFGNAGYDHTEILPFCCEMHEVNFRDSSLGQMLPPLTERKYSLLFQNDSVAVVAISFSLSNEFQDFYAYFIKLDNWHIESMRTLAKTDVIRIALTEIENLSPDEAMKVIEKSGYDDLDKYINRNKLLLSSDSNIEQYFNDNKTQFQQIVDYISKNKILKTFDDIKYLNGDEFIISKLKPLLIAKIVSAEEEGDFIGFLIGGLIDNTAGYFYQPDIRKVPPISKNLYIMIKPLGNGWFMYKTT